MSTNCDALKAFRDKLQRLSTDKVDRFCIDCSKELAARLLAKVIKRTKTGTYAAGSGKVGGTLRRGWTGGKRANASAYANTLPVHTFGDTYVIEVINPTKYASYVEFGHRTRNHRGWVNGQFMLTISEKEIKELAPKLLERKLEAFFREVMH